MHRLKLVIDKTFLALFTLVVSISASNAQLEVSSEILEGTNRFSAHLCSTCDSEDIAEDLFFSIGPNGTPQYGQHPAWNLEEYSSGNARYFHIKKGEWDEEAIVSHDETVTFETNPTIFPTSSNPNTDMEGRWIKLGKSWNFSQNNYAYAIVSFMNLDSRTIDKGTLTFRHVDYDMMGSPEFVIYNDWLQLNSTSSEGGELVYQFNFEELRPKEIRYLYVKIRFTDKKNRVLPPFPMQATLNSFVSGTQTADLIEGGIIPPHDPNSLVLVNAFENTPQVEDCTQFEPYHELVNHCEKGKPFWYIFTKKQPYLDYSLNYPYCNIDSEVLNYRLSCLNVGGGPARDISMEVNFDDIKPEPLLPEVFSYDSPDQVDGRYDYPLAEFYMDEIYLPGLGSEEYVYTYDECSSHINFSVQTKCDLSEEITAGASITFYDLDEVPVDPVFTEEVTIVPEQGVYSNYTPDCISCFTERTDNRSLVQFFKYQMVKHRNSLHLSYEVDASIPSTQIRIADMTGQIHFEKSITNNSDTIVNEQIDLSNLSPGVYVVITHIGNKTITNKFVHF